MTPSVPASARDASAAADHAAARAAVEAREAELYRAQIAEDVDAIRPFLADELIYIHSTGVAESKSAYLAGVSGKLYEYGMIRSRDKRVAIHGDLAIIDGIVDMTVSAGGAPKVLIHLLFCLILGSPGTELEFAL